jgi:hypothetical protein
MANPPDWFPLSFPTVAERPIGNPERGQPLGWLDSRSDLRSAGNDKARSAGFPNDPHGRCARRRSRPTKARDFDEKFDAGADVSGDVDWGKARPNVKLKRVNVDFPAWVVEALDREARRLA